jgi:hypothetical protein
MKYKLIYLEPPKFINNFLKTSYSKPLSCLFFLFFILDFYFFYFTYYLFIDFNGKHNQILPQS